MIEVVAETASTNADLLTGAIDGAPEGTWLRAEGQTAGRGRMGREWHSPSGNLYASTIVRLCANDPQPATLALVAAVALAETLRAAAPGAEVAIKWPNDVLAAGAKISGILLERAGDAVVVGFGVNLASHPQDLDRATTSVAALSVAAPDPHAFCEQLAESLADWIARWRADLQPVRLAWERLAHPPGTALDVALGDGGRLSGSYDGLADDGGLRLRLADGSIRVIHAGDVFLV